MISPRLFMVAVMVMALAYYLKNKGSQYRLQGKALEEYDYVIVGGGTSGCVLANRLSEHPDVSVLLLEAGDVDSSQPLHDVPMATRSLLTTNLTWGELTTPQSQACLGMLDKRCRVLRGRSVGGSTTINSLQYQRGSRHDYDTWARMGAAGWTYDEVLPYFIKAESNSNHKFVETGYHGSQGPLVVSDVLVTSLPEAFVTAGQQLGYDAIDINGRSQQGFMATQATITRGRRMTVTRGYLLPAMERKNLHLVTGALVHKVLFREDEAIGVQYEHNGTHSTVSARKEVILAAGAIGSAHILLMSGVGPQQHLTDIGVPVVADLPVGENLQDHMTLRDLEYKLKEPIAITAYKISSFWAWFDYQLFGTGFWSDVMSEGSAFVTTETSESEDQPDVQISMSPLLLGNDVGTMDQEKSIHNLNEKMFDAIHADCEGRDGFGLYTTLIRPQSRGTVRLHSKDPHKTPLVDPKYFSDSRDLQTLIQGIRISQQLSNTPMLKDMLGGTPVDNIHPGCAGEKLDTDAYWNCFLRYSAVPESHYAGTCRMGALDDPKAVVDATLSVHKLKRLRVVDASVMPTITAGNTYIPTVMIAEKASDMILGKITVHRANITAV